MKIEFIRVKNFKALKDIEINTLSNLNIFVGANGTGKTTLFDVFGFLKDCLIHNVTKAIQSRGGYNELVSRGYTDQDIEIELKYRMKIADKERLVTYLLTIGRIDKKITVKREILRYKRGSSGSPFHFLDFKNGKGDAILNEEDFSKPDEELQKEKQNLDSSDILAIKGLGQFERFKAANAFRQLIEGWHVSDFHINLARGSKDAAGFSEHLSIEGDNLQLVANNIKENYPEIFDKILNKMKQRVPGVGNITTEPTPDGRLILRFHDGSFKDPFIDKFVSDGTIKMFAYLILLYDPNPYPLLCIEEPENQLYLKLLDELVEEFREYARLGGQIFVSTHSPDLLNAAKINEVFWIVKKDGFAQIFPASGDEQIKAYMAEGDKMGYLWKQGFFPGVDPL
jgi:predicted ATPase